MTVKQRDILERRESEAASFYPQRYGQRSICFDSKGIPRRSGLKDSARIMPVNQFKCERFQLRDLEEETKEKKKDFQSWRKCLTKTYTETSSAKTMIKS